MEEFLRKGSFAELGFYVWLRGQVQVDSPFRLRFLADKLMVTDCRISQQLRRLRELGAIDVETCGPKGLRVTKFNFDFEVRSNG